MKIHPVGAELFYADRQTDRHDNANSRFSKFCKSTQKSLLQQKGHTYTCCYKLGTVSFLQWWLRHEFIKYNSV